MPDDNLIVAKLKRYYTATTLDFRDSAECQELLKNFIEKTNDKNPEVYLVIKQLLHELDKYRGVPSSRVSKLEKLLQVYIRQFFFIVIISETNVLLHRN